MHNRSVPYWFALCLISSIGLIIAPLTPLPHATASPDQQIGSRTYNDTDPRLVYGGDWSTQPHADAWGETFTITDDPHAALTIYFEGTGIRLRLTAGPDGGDFSGRLDHFWAQFGDSYAAESTPGTVLAFDDLPAGRHTLHIDALSGAFALEAVEIDGLLLAPFDDESGTAETQPWTYYPDNHPALVYGGAGWAPYPVVRALDGTLTASDTPASTLDVFFTGSGARLIVSRGPDGGSAQVRLDDGAPVVLDSGGDSFSYNHVLAFEDLTPGTHHLALTLDSGAVWIEGVAVQGDLTHRPAASLAIPAQPTLRAPSVGDRVNHAALLLAWDAVAGAALYDVQIATASDFASGALVPDDQPLLVTTTDYTPGPLPDGTYYWRVRGLNAAQTAGRWSGIYSFTVDSVPPDVPVPRQPADASETTRARPLFKWSSVADAHRYELRIGQTEPLSGPVIERNNRRYRPPSPLAVGRYVWQVRAVDRAGNASAWSTPSTLTIISPTNAVPRLNRVDGTPTLTWDVVTWAAEYAVMVDNNRDFSSPDFRATTGELFITPDDLPPGTWYWRIRARRDSGAWGRWSTRGSFTVVG